MKPHTIEVHIRQLAPLVRGRFDASIEARIAATLDGSDDFAASLTSLCATAADVIRAEARRCQEVREAEDRIAAKEKELADLKSLAAAEVDTELEGSRKTARDLRADITDDVARELESLRAQAAGQASHDGERPSRSRDFTDFMPDDSVGLLPGEIDVSAANAAGN